LSHWIEKDRALIIKWLNLHRKKFYTIDHFAILIDFNFFLTLSTLDLLSTSRSHKNLFVINLLTLFESCTFSKPRKIMVTLIQWSSSQKSMSKFSWDRPPQDLSRLKRVSLRNRLRERSLKSFRCFRRRRQMCLFSSTASTGLSEEKFLDRNLGAAPSGSQVCRLVKKSYDCI